MEGLTSSDIDYRKDFQTQFEELNKYLAAYLANAPPNWRSSSRQKLFPLTVPQFHELSTDVYDELMRRQHANFEEEPFLLNRLELHPKRNQVRKKLATLPTHRFQDLAGDVHDELLRRNAEFEEDMYVA